MKRQKHGFIYQEEIIDRFSLSPESGYTSKWDAYCDDIPVSIKTTRLGGDIELADFFRQSSIDEDFYLVVGFHDSNNEIIEEHLLYIPKENWNKMIDKTFISIFKELLKNCSNDNSYDEEWKQQISSLKKDWTKKTSNLIRPRFKRDHKSQKRIQCAINNKDFYNYFIPNFEVEME